MKETMNHEEIRGAFADIYNVFYLKHRKKEEKRTEDEWEKIIADADEIYKKYNSTMVRDFLMALMREFENEESEGK